MQTSIKISESRKKVKAFRTLRWRAFVNPTNNRAETFWLVHTNFRKGRFISYMKMKHLIEGLPEDEQQILFDFPGVLEDDLFVNALRAKQTGVSLKTLEEKFHQLFLMGITKEEFSSNLFYTLDGTITYQIYRIERAIGKVKKFSGYVRNSSSVGSKRAKTTQPDPEHFVWTNAVEYDYYSFFTVGDLISGASGGLIFTLKSSNRTKRKTKPNILSK